MQRGSPLLRMAVISIGALALRPQLIGIGPLVPEIRADLGMTFAEAGLLTTIPLLCMGIFALLAPTLVAVWGAGRTVAACVAILAVSGALRAVAPGSLALLVLTIPVGLGIGVGGATLPVLVKDWLPGRAASATAVYTFFIQVGSVGSSAVAVPLSLAAGGWRWPLGIFAVSAVLVLAGWLLLAERPDSRPRGFGRASITPIAWREPVAWLLAAIFAMTAIPYYGLSAWLTSAYVERGWTPLDAGSLFAAFALTGLPGSLVAGFMADRLGRQQAMILSTSVVIASLVVLILAPPLAWPAALIGGGFLGSMFTIGLTLPIDVSRDASRVAPVVGLMMSVGYCLMAFMPSLLGGIRDVTGSFTISLWVIVAACFGLLGASLLASPRRLGGMTPP
jgi:CP family cyanate transporter-like MFS transporter